METSNERPKNTFDTKKLLRIGIGVLGITLFGTGLIDSSKNDKLHSQAVQNLQKEPKFMEIEKRIKVLEANQTELMNLQKTETEMIKSEYSKFGQKNLGNKVMAEIGFGIIAIMVSGIFTKNRKETVD